MAIVCIHAILSLGATNGFTASSSGMSGIVPEEEQTFPMDGVQGTKAPWKLRASDRWRII